MNRWAFLVGISNYERPGFNDLDFADRHVSELAQILKDSNEYNLIVHLKTDDQDQNKPTRNHIISKFDILLKNIEPKDTLIIYFVCHGGFYKGRNLIFPQDANKSDTDILIDTSISIDWFIKRLVKYESEAWNVFFIIDACREQLDKSMGTKELDSALHIKTFKDKNIDRYLLGYPSFFLVLKSRKLGSLKKKTRI